MQNTDKLYLLVLLIISDSQSANIEIGVLLHFSWISSFSTQTLSVWVKLQAVKKKKSGMFSVYMVTCLSNKILKCANASSEHKENGLADADILACLHSFSLSYKEVSGFVGTVQRQIWKGWSDSNWESVWFFPPQSLYHDMCTSHFLWQ